MTIADSTYGPRQYVDPQWEEMMRQNPVAQIPPSKRTVTQVLELLALSFTYRVLAEHTPPGYGHNVLLAYAQQQGFAPSDRAPERLRRLLAQVLTDLAHSIVNADAYGRKSMSTDEWFRRQHAAMLKLHEDRRASRRVMEAGL